MPVPEHPWRPSWSWRLDLPVAIAIGLLALLLRLAYVRQFASHPYGRFPWVDENAYWTWALAIRGGALLPKRPFYQDPLFAYLLAALMSVVGTSFEALRLSLACLGSLTPVIVYWAGRIGFGRSEAIVAGLMAAAYRPLVFNDGLLEKEGTGALVAALALALTARGGRWLGLAGFAWGSLALLRANALFVGPLGIAWCLWFFGPLERGVRLAAGFALGFGLALVPAVAVNTLVANPPEVLLTTWQAGANFYIGNGPEADGQYTKLPFVIDNPLYEADNFRAEAQRRAGRPLSPGQVSRFWLSEGLKRWKTDPMASLRLLAWKLALVCSDFEIFDNQSEELVRTVVAPALGWSWLSLGWVWPLAALGLIRPRLERTPFWWFVVLTTVGGLFSTALFFVVGRYRIPWVPGLALLAGAGLIDTTRRLRGRRWKELVLGIGLLAAPAAALAWAPTAETLTPGRWALFSMRMFTAYEAAGRLDDALDAIDDGRALDPRTARAFETSLDGVVAAAQKQRLAIAIDRRLDQETARPGPEPALRLARWLRLLPDESGRQESRRLLEDALKLSPDNPRLHRELGAWWLGQWRDPAARTEALAELRRAARGQGGDAGAAVMLALLMGDKRWLPVTVGPGGDPGPSRLRMARAALAARGRR